MDAKHFEALASLTNLNLASNGITLIEEGTFESLVNLYRLDLNTNKLTSISVGIFKGLSNLYFLDLRKNLITAFSHFVLFFESQLRKVMPKITHKFCEKLSRVL